MSRFMGFVIYGLSSPYESGSSAAKPVMFTNLGIEAAQLPAEFADYLILPILPFGEDVGETFSSEPRRPLGQGGSQKITIPEDSTGTWGGVFLPDPTKPTWDIKDPIITEAQTTIQAVGDTTPVVNQILWLEEEALRVLGVSPLANSALTYNLIVSRGACGSFVRRHTIDPATYGEGADGTEERLFLESRPNWESHRFKCALFAFKQAINRNGVATELHRRNLFLDKVPEIVEDGDFAYHISPTPIQEVIQKHEISRGPKTLKLAHRIRIVELFSGYSSGGYISFARRAKVILSAKEVEELFQNRVRKGTPTMNQGLVEDLLSRLEVSSEVNYYLSIRSNGEWTYRITGGTIAALTAIGPGSQSTQSGAGNSGAQRFLLLDLELIHRAPGSSLSDSLVSNPSPGEEQATEDQPFGSGWTDSDRAPVPAGEEAPEIQLWIKFETTPIRALLFWMLSSGAASGREFDTLVMGGLSLPDAWVNTGTAAAAGTELDIDPRTTELLKLDQLLNENITPFFQPADNLGTFFSQLATLYMLMFVPLSSGKITFRRWATKEGASLPILRPTKTRLGAGDFLTPLRAIRLLSGINLLDLSPEYGRTILIKGPKKTEEPETLEARIWKTGNQLSDEAITSEGLQDLFRAFFTTLGGSPRRLPVECDLEVDNHEPGDAVLYSDAKMPTPDGTRGFENERFIVVNKDVNHQEGSVTYHLLRDFFNENSVSEGVIAPALEIEHILSRSVDGRTVTVLVKSLGEHDFDLTSDHSLVWNKIETATAHVRVYHPEAHNPDVDEERLGYAELYATVTDIFYDAASNDNRLTLSIAASWEREGFTVKDILKTGARIVFPDRRTESDNPEGALIEPVAQQLNGNADIAKWGGRRSFDNHFTLIAS